MIRPTEADIGRRVVYDPRPVLKHRSFGHIVGIKEHSVRVLFDDAETPLNVISNLKWADNPSPRHSSNATITRTTPE